MTRTAFFNLTAYINSLLLMSLTGLCPHRCSAEDAASRSQQENQRWCRPQARLLQRPSGSLVDALTCALALNHDCHARCVFCLPSAHYGCCVFLEFC
jgi:hypothetical protein